MSEVSETVAEDVLPGDGIEREIDAVDEDREEEIDNGFEADANPRDDVQGLMVPIGQITGWQGGDPPAEWLVRSVAKRLHTPILVRETGKKRHPYEVVDGRRRLKALRDLKATDVPVVIDNTLDDLDMLAIFLNSARSDNVIHSARAVGAKLDAGQSDKEIALEAANGDAKLANAILPKVRALRDIITRLHPELLKAVEDGNMNSWSARMAARQPDAVQSRLIDRLHEHGKVTADDVIEERKAKVSAIVADYGEVIDATPDFEDETEYQESVHESYRDTEDADATADDAYAEPAYQGATSEGKLSRGPADRKASAIRLLTAAATELGFIRDDYDSVPNSIELVEDIITTLREEG